jgi:hypothetical protein
MTEEKKRKKPELKPGQRIFLSDDESKSLEVIFKEADDLEHLILSLNSRLRKERTQAWNSFWTLYPQYGAWNIRWNRADKTLELLYPKSDFEKSYFKQEV